METMSEHVKELKEPYMLDSSAGAFQKGSIHIRNIPVGDFSG
jgi:hypothetical protein